MFTQHARGSAVDKYLAQLVDACDKMWLAGRQLCEEISLTGNHCVNPVSQGVLFLPVRAVSLRVM